MPTAHRASPRCNPQRSAQTADGVSSVDKSLLQSIAFERLLADLSAGFINLAADKVDAAITDSLLRITVALGVDRAELVHFAPDPAGHLVTHSAVVPGVIEGAPNAFARRFPWVTRQILAGRHFAFGRLDELPAEANVDKASWQKFKVKSCVGVPIHVGGQIDSAIGVDCMRKERTWPAELVERLQVLATIFGNALAHKRTSQELEAAIAFERMTTDIMGTLLQAPRAQHDTVLEAGLRQVAQAFGADRATLWQRVGDSADFTKSHRWTADSQVAALPVPAAGLSWVNAQLLRGSVVRFASHAELPAEAATDVSTLHTLGIGAAVIVPLEMSGRVAGALSIGTTREHVDWPDVLLPRAQLLGQAFASYIARQQAEQRQLQAQAQAAHAARVATLGVFAASLVHELTQPLAASLANAETARNLLARPAPALDEARDTVADIVTDSRRAGELIQKLRRFLRHGEAEHGAIEAQGLITEVLSFVASESAGKGISITLDVSEGLPGFIGDRVQMQQVLLNLLLNAFDAVTSRPPGERRVQLRAYPAASGLAIEIGDNGPGMDAVTLARIFQPFFTTKPGGMGLGLSICQTIVSSHGGTIRASSSLGQGTRFHIQLPLRQPLIVGPNAPAATPVQYGDCVFVVDDDDAMRRALERQLTAEGYRVQGFANAHAFLDGAPQAEVACIVSDVRMPGLSGLDLQATLARGVNDWPIIFISGHADVPTSVHAMKAGAAAFLSKPFAQAELLAAVSDALATSRQRVAARHQHADAAAAPPLAHAARGRGLRAGGAGPAEQAGRRPAGHRGKHGEDPSRPCHGKDGGAVGGRAGAHGASACPAGHGCGDARLGSA